MSEYKTVGTPIEKQNQPHNHSEHGIEVERQALADKAARRDEARPTGKPFTIEAPKNYPVVEQSEANPLPQPGSDEPRALGKPHVVAPPPSLAEIAQSAGKTYPRRKV